MVDPPPRAVSRRAGDSRSRHEVDMARKPDSTAHERVVIAMDEPDTSDLRPIGGSRSDRFNNALIAVAVNTGWFPPDQSDEERSRQMFVAVTSLQAFAAADEIEAMIAAQAMAAHHASMECSRRAMLADQPFEAAQGLRKAAANASRTFVELLSALDRRRGKGGQQVASRLYASSMFTFILEQTRCRKHRCSGHRGRGGCWQKPGRTLYIASPTGARHFPWRSPAPAAGRGRGVGDHAEVRRCRTAAAECTAEAAPDLRQRRVWRGSGPPGQRTGCARPRWSRCARWCGNCEPGLSGWWR